MVGSLYRIMKTETLSEVRLPSINLSLPPWVEDFVEKLEGRDFSDVEERMHVAIELAKWNQEQGTGGPFGAAVFNLDSFELVAPGVNVVVASHCSLAHAEMMALSLAQKKRETYDLGGVAMPKMELVTSTEPCAMCMGATVWSGVRRLVCGARDSDARKVGFDEGPKPVRWPGQLRNEPAQVLCDQADQEGMIYNGRSSGFSGAAQGDHFSADAW